MLNRDNGRRQTFCRECFWPSLISMPIQGDAMKRLAKFVAIVLGLVAFSADGHTAEVDQPAALVKLFESTKPVTIVCLGDSVTGVYYHTGSRRAYPEMLELALHQALPHAKVEVINAGISGNTTQNGLDRLDRDVLSKRPQLVTISFGLNDMTRIAPDVYRQNLTTLIERCRATGAEAVLCTPNAVINTGGRPIAKLVSYCAIIHEVGKSQNVLVCDQFAAGNAHIERDAWNWRLTMSDAIHPNMAGHKLMAEELCHTISGKRVSLADARPVDPALQHTLSQIANGKPVSVLATPPFDTMITATLKAIDPKVEASVTSWPMAGKTLADIQADSAKLVRPMKPDLVILAVPREATAASDEAFVNAYSWVMNNSLNFGKPTWDCIVVHPSVLLPGETHARDQLARQLVAAQDLHLIDRAAGDTSSAAKLFARELLQRSFVVGKVRQIVAHRGSSADRPENTLASTLRAIESGATAIEVDVRTTRDGHLVLSHDATVDRVTNGSGKINELSLDELRKLDAGAKFDPRYAGEKIATLAEVCVLCRGKIDVLLDLKETGDEYVRRVVDVVNQSGDARRTIVGVRTLEQAREFRKLLPETRQIGLIAQTSEIESFAQAGVETIRLWPKWLTDTTLVPRVRKAGAKLHINGADGSVEVVEQLLALDPDSTSSDAPVWLMRTLHAMRRR